MHQVPPEIHALARQLIAWEAACAASDSIPALRVCEKFRVLLMKLAGVAGFRSLLSRALALARVEFAALQSLIVRSDGTLESVAEVPSALATGGGDEIVAQLLGLLVTFVGEPLTLGLVRDGWPESTDLETGPKEQP